MYYVLGGKGFNGSAVRSVLEECGETVISIGRDTYADLIGTSCDVFVNCDGNARRFWANENPAAEEVDRVHRPPVVMIPITEA